MECQKGNIPRASWQKGWHSGGSSQMLGGLAGAVGAQSRGPGSGSRDAARPPLASPSHLGSTSSMPTLQNHQHLTRVLSTPNPPLPSPTLWSATDKCAVHKRHMDSEPVRALHHCDSRQQVCCCYTLHILVSNQLHCLTLPLPNSSCSVHTPTRLVFQLNLGTQTMSV